MMKIDEKTAIRKRIKVQKRKDGIVLLYLPQVFFENGLVLEDEIDLCMDKNAKAVFFQYGQDCPEDSTSAAAGDV
jgi:hypothetical protein